MGSEGVEEGQTILAEAVDFYREVLGDRLVAAYALGSLAHGGFSPLVSDIDIGLILAHPFGHAASATGALHAGQHGPALVALTFLPVAVMAALTALEAGTSAGLPAAARLRAAYLATPPASRLAALDWRSRPPYTLPWP